jgi:hypothetical protein
VDANGVKVRFADPDTQLKAKDALQQKLGDNYIVALNLLSSSPQWLASIGALPMYLGLDLRGGVHFLLQVDMQAALTKRIEGLGGEIRSNLRDKNVRHAGIVREGQTLRIRFREAASRTKARDVIGVITNDLALVDREDGQDLMLVGTLKPEAQKAIYYLGGPDLSAVKKSPNLEIFRRKGIEVMDGDDVHPPTGTNVVGWSERGHLDELGHKLGLDLPLQQALQRARAVDPSRCDEHAQQNGERHRHTRQHEGDD